MCHSGQHRRQHQAIGDPLKKPRFRTKPSRQHQKRNGCSQLIPIHSVHGSGNQIGGSSTVPCQQGRQSKIHNQHHGSIHIDHDDHPTVVFGQEHSGQDDLAEKRQQDSEQVRTHQPRGITSDRRRTVTETLRHARGWEVVFNTLRLRKGPQQRTSNGSPAHEALLRFPRCERTGSDEGLVEGHEHGRPVQLAPALR